MSRRHEATPLLPRAAPTERTATLARARAALALAERDQARCILSAGAIPKQGNRWDERRNTSRVFPVPPGALADALKALADWREREPAHAAWVAAGAPPIRSDAEHLARFGEPYKQRPRRVK